MGGWLEKVKLKLNSIQVVVEVEVRVELGKSENLAVIWSKSSNFVTFKTKH